MAIMIRSGEGATRDRTGPQQKFNPEKSCRTKYHFSLVQICLENMPDVVLT